MPILKCKVEPALKILAKDASEIMTDVKEIMKKVREGIENETSKNVVREILENINEVSASLRRTVGSNEEKLNNIIASVEELAQQLAYETNGKNQDSLMNGLKKLSPILDDLKDASSDIKIIIGDVKAGKGTVGKLLRDEETVDRVNETLSSVNRLMGRINNLQAEISVYSGYNNKFQGSTQLGIDLYTAPERFFRIGAIVNDFYYITEETESSSTGSAGNTNNVTRTTNKDEFKFNFQLGRKIQDFSFRIGLFESKGGVGVDYDISSWNTKLSADLFNFDRDDQPAFLRLSSEIRIWNVLYSKLVLEDVLSDNLSYTVYGGLRFTDDDIASLISILAR
jgi:phospholipid/cholesterol/gamma-HCH transport system substrate-binding protein